MADAIEERIRENAIGILIIMNKKNELKRIAIAVASL
jgi:hypothetical protein